MTDRSLLRQRQVLYWRLLGQAFGAGESFAGIEALSEAIVAKAGMPRVILDPELGVDTLLKRHPGLQGAFDAVRHQVEEPADPKAGEPDPEAGEPEDAVGDEAAAAPEARVGGEENPIPHTLAFSKLVLNVFGPMARAPRISATQYHQWLEDVAAFELYLGFEPGGLQSGTGSRGGGGGGRGLGPGGNRKLIDDEQLREELRAMESDLSKRMDLREILQDDALASKITPTLAVVEQLLYDKSNLSGNALKNARALVKKYVDELAAVLKKQVLSSSTGKLELSQPPKRAFRNLDLKRTLWKNLPNYNPADGRIYVDQLYYRRTAQKQLLNKIIVVVDQSGSMVDAMVQCAILASVFAGLPRVDVSLIAYDTSAIDLTPWVHDPFEALMRTNLGGGTHGPVAMAEARQHISDPRRTTMVWISDFYDDRSLLGMFKGLKESGVCFIPVGSVSSKGYFNVDGWFRAELKRLGMPILTGNIKKLIVELKGQLQ